MAYFGSRIVLERQNFIRGVPDMFVWFIQATCRHKRPYKLLELFRLINERSAPELQPAFLDVLPALNDNINITSIKLMALFAHRLGWPDLAGILTRASSAPAAMMMYLPKMYIAQVPKTRYRSNSGRV
jgi:hypothetical protein